MSEFIRVAYVEEIPVGTSKLVQLKGKGIAIFNINGSFHAIDNDCTHVGGPLCEGELDGVEVTCPWHAAVFDVTSGAALNPPAMQPVTHYNVRLQGTHVEIEFSPTDVGNVF